MEQKPQLLDNAGDTGNYLVRGIARQLWGRIYFREHGPYERQSQRIPLRHTGCAIDLGYGFFLALIRNADIVREALPAWG